MEIHQAVAELHRAPIDLSSEELMAIEVAQVDLQKRNWAEAEILLLLIQLCSGKSVKVMWIGIGMGVGTEIGIDSEIVHL